MKREEIIKRERKKLRKEGIKYFTEPLKKYWEERPEEATTTLIKEIIITYLIYSTIIGITNIPLYCESTQHEYGNMILKQEEWLESLEALRKNNTIIISGNMIRKDTMNLSTWEIENNNLEQKGPTITRTCKYNITAFIQETTEKKAEITIKNIYESIIGKWLTK